MPRANLTPATVLAAAADLSDRSGFDAVTVSAVAETVGVRPASLYSHVRDLAALREGVHLLALDALADEISASTAGVSGRPALDALLAAHRRFATARPGLWAALQRPATAATAGSAEAARLSSLLLAVLRGYDLPETEFVHATRFVAGTINGFVNLEQASAFAHRPAATDESERRAVDALDRALRSWPRPHPEEGTRA